MADEFIYAYTQPGIAPEFLSVRGTETGVEIIVRAPGDETGNCGATFSLFLSREEAYKFGNSLSHYVVTHG